jgi:ElaA protein
MNTIVWKIVAFDDMRARELHDCLALRAAVFVVEQNCPYQDPEEKDLKSLHVLGYLDDALVATARIVAPGVSYPEVSIGRVATAASHRGTGAGKALMQVCLDAIAAKYGNVPVRISAQSYLQRFYESFGFQRTPKPEYLEDDIPHVEMLRPA